MKMSLRTRAASISLGSALRSPAESAASSYFGVDGRETRAHLFELIQIGHNGSSGQQHEKVLHLLRFAHSGELKSAP